MARFPPGFLWVWPLAAVGSGIANQAVADTLATPRSPSFSIPAPFFRFFLPFLSHEGQEPFSFPRRAQALLPGLAAC